MYLIRGQGPSGTLGTWDRDSKTKRLHLAFGNHSLQVDLRRPPSLSDGGFLGRFQQGMPIFTPQEDHNGKDDGFSFSLGSNGLFPAISHKI